MATNTTITISAVDKTKQAFDSVDRSLKKMTSAFSAAQAAVGGLVASFAVKEFTGFLDAATRIENKLKLVTESSNDLAKAQAEVFRVSQTTGAGLEQTADLYSKIVSSTEALNLSSKDQIQITETISKAISISGASAEGAAGAITQLGQALGAGALRGEEFNSVNEQAPRIMQALADSLGIPRGELKKLASDGVLTADIVTEALLIQSQTIDEEYGKTTTTVAESFTKLKNSAVVFFGVLDDNTGISTLFSETLSQMASGLDNVTGSMKPATVQSLSKEIRDLSNAQAEELLALDKLVTENTSLDVIQQNQARTMRLNTAERAEKIKNLQTELESLNNVVAAQKEENKETGSATSTSKLSAEMLERRSKLREQLNKLTGGTLELSKEEINYQDKIYEIGKKNSLVTGEVSEANKAYFASVKTHLTDAEAVMAAKQEEAVHAASSALSAMTLKDTTGEIGRLLATQGSAQDQLAAAMEAEKLVKSEVLSLASQTGDEAARQKEVLQGMTPALAAHVQYAQGMVAEQKAGLLTQVEKSKQALLEQATYEKAVKDVADITKNLQDQESVDIAKKAIEEQKAYEAALKEVEKITEQMRIQEEIDLSIQAIERQQAEDESLKLLEKQAKTAMDIASALDAAETLKAMKAQEEVLKEQEESVRFLNEQAGWQLARAVKLGQLQEEQALALAEQIGAQDAFNEGLMLTSDLYSYINSEAKSLNKGIKEGAKALADSETFKAVTGAAGASGGRAMQITQAFAEGGLEKGLLSLVLSNEKVQEALGKVFDALFALIDPVINMLVPVIDALIPVINALSPIFAKLQKPIEKLSPLLIKLIERLEPFLNHLLQLINVIEGIFRPIEVAIETVLKPLSKVMEGLGQKIEAFFKPMTDAINKLFGGFDHFTKGIADAFTTGVGKIGENLGKAFETLYIKLPEKIWQGIIKMFGEGTFSLFNYVVENIKKIIQFAGTFSLLNYVIDKVKGIIQFAGTFNLFSYIEKAVENILQISGSILLINIIQNGISAILDSTGSIKLLDTLKSAVGSIFNTSGSIKILDTLKSAVGSIFDNTGSIKLLDTLKSAVGSIIDTKGSVTLLDEISDGISDILDTDGSINLPKLLEDAVKDIFDAVIPAGKIGLLPNPFNSFGLGPKNLLEFKFAKGGYLNGPSHAAGGMPAIVGGKRPVELEGGEFIIRKSAVRSLGLQMMYALNSATNYSRAEQMRQALGMDQFAAGGLADKWLAYKPPFYKWSAGMSLRDLGSVGNKIADIIGNHGASFKLIFPNKQEGKIFGIGGLISEGTKTNSVGKTFIDQGNDLLGRIKASFNASFFPVSMSMKASYKKPSWFPFEAGGQVPVLRNGAASPGAYAPAGGIEVNIYDGTGQRISEYDSALRVEVKERAARFSQFSAVA